MSLRSAPTATKRARISRNRTPGVLEHRSVAEIRAFEREDVADVAALYELVMRSGRSTPAPGLAPYFERLFFDQPWADPEHPGLVAVDRDGKIVAFQGAHARKGRFDGRAIAITGLGQLVSHPDARTGAIGRALVRTQLAGPQDLTLTDTATPAVQRLGVMMGGTISHLSCIGWVRVMRPLQSAQAFARSYREARRRPAAPRVMARLDRALTRSAPALSAPATPDVEAEPLTPGGLVEHLSLVSDHLRLYVDYDEPYVEWLFTELRRMAGLGALLARLVRTRRGRPLGWYVCMLEPGGSCRVLQVAAPNRHVGQVLDHLMHEAWMAGAANVHGRVEPHLLEALATRRCLMLYRGGALLYGEPPMLGAIATGNALLTRLDGEWWVQDQMVDLSR